MINLYWNIGKMIVDKQYGNKKAKYKEYLIKQLSIKLTKQFGKGFSIQNLRRMGQFYIIYPICSTLSSELSWSHYLELIKIKEDYKTIFSSEFRLTIPSEKEFINLIEKEKKNMELI